MGACCAPSHSPRSPSTPDGAAALQRGRGGRGARGGERDRHLREDQPVRGPLRIEQGEDDTTVFPAFTDQTVAGYEADGVEVDYHKRPGVNHGGIVMDTAVQKAATKWIAKRLR